MEPKSTISAPSLSSASAYFRNQGEQGKQGAVNVLRT